MSLTVRLLSPDDVASFDAHFARHRRETGRGDIHFMPFEPDGDDGPRGLDLPSLDLPLTSPGWQRWFVALDEAGPGVVGHLNLKGDPLRSGLHRCLLGIGIERPYRARGLGKRLMTTAIDFARAADSIAWVDLMVFGHNAAARALYRSLGFVEIGTVVDRFRVAGTSIDDVIMTLDVS